MSTANLPPESLRRIGPYVQQMAPRFGALYSAGDLPPLCDGLIATWQMIEEAADDVEGREEWDAYAGPLREVAESVYAASVDCGHATRLFQEGRNEQALAYMADINEELTDAAEPLGAVILSVGLGSVHVAGLEDLMEVH